MANSEQLPSSIVESLKHEKEDRARIENIEKINASLRDKQISLSEEQTNQLIALRNSLESNSLQELEDKMEANETANKTLSLLGDIRDNTEDLNFDFGAGAEGIVQKIIVFGQLLLTTFVSGFIKGVASIFKFPTLEKLFNTLILKPLKFIFSPVIKLFTYMSNVFRAIGDVYKKVGTAQFLKANTFKVLGAQGIIFLQSIFKRVKSIVNLFKSFALLTKSAGTSIRTFMLKPFNGITQSFKNIGAAFKDIAVAFNKISSGRGPLANIINSIKTIGGLLNKFKGLFKALGFLAGKLLFPIIAIIDFTRGILDSLKTSEFTSPLARAVDALLTGVGFAVGGFIGGLLDLIKSGFSLLADKLGFEGLSEFLDSFSIREMIERGFSDMAEFFSSLFTDFVPALISGIKAAAIPGGKSFKEAFDERLAYGPGGKPQNTVILREGEVTPEEFERYAAQTEGMSPSEQISFIKAQRNTEQSTVSRRRGRRASFRKISNTTGAEMDAIQTDTADVKASPAVIPSGVVANMQSIDNSTSSVVKTTNMNNHIDRTSIAAAAPAY